MTLRVHSPVGRCVLLLMHWNGSKPARLPDKVHFPEQYVQDLINQPAGRRSRWSWHEARRDEHSVADVNSHRELVSGLRIDLPTQMCDIPNKNRPITSAGSEKSRIP